jgi:hypothetical protein
MNCMSRSSASPDGWHPKTQQDRDAVLRELQKVLASPHFCNSKRYPALLKYIVENTLAGKADLLKERTLGVEVFERPATYDTNADTVVRYTAGEVRKRLLLFYHEDGKDSNIRIYLPAGSYVPEFLQGHEKAEETRDPADLEARSLLKADSFEDRKGGVAELALASQHGMADRPFWPVSPAEIAASLDQGRRKKRSRILLWSAATFVVVIAAAAGFLWRYRTSHPETIVDEFWAPVLRDQHQVVICTGSVVFAQNRYSGVITAGANGNVEYPFVSMQGAAAIAEIEAAMERSGIRTQLIAAPWSTLTDLREHSVTLLGAYNNQWTIRLMEPLRYHFMPDPQARIVDGMQPATGWERDQSVPYSNADDYALVARFRDPTTDGWVVALAGLGRNGTEAAAQFVTSPHYLELLKEKMGSNFGNRNIEVVLKVKVIEAKTGAPSILAVYTW